MTFTEIIQSYLKEKEKHKQCELEVRFGRNPPKPMRFKPLSRIDYNHVIQHLLSMGFTCKSMQGEDLLRIGVQGYRNIRVEMEGIDTIQRYCKNNELHTQKFIMKEPITRLDVPEYRLQASLSEERPLDNKSPEVKALTAEWDKVRKSFRYINRIRLQKEGNPMYVDCSIVKMSSQKDFRTVYTSSIQESNVFYNSEAYEIEVEVDPKSDSMPDIKRQLNEVIKYVLGGLQQSQFPISYVEMETIRQEYLDVIVDKKRRFIGPSQVTLQISNLLENTGEISVRHNYTVTAKADGERKLLYISSSGRAYFIKSSNLLIEFTGMLTEVKELFFTIADGEHILHDKHGQFLNLYAMFDIYFIQKVDVRSHEFYNTSRKPGTYRSQELGSFFKKLMPTSVVKTSKPLLKLQVKEFYLTSDSINIFQVCNDVLNRSIDYIYNTDGLIFTPTNYGVGKSPKKSEGSRWDMNFKWKPAQFNTVDFLIEVEKVDGKEKIVNSFAMDDSYKTLLLKVGFNPKDSMMNPCQYMLDDTVPMPTDETYKAVQFFPSDGSPGQVCKIPLRRDKNNEYQMFTESGEVFHDNMVVEFRYDNVWIPLRVRWDKTVQLLESVPGTVTFGNDYKTADSNWNSIHHPVDERMLRTGQNIPEMSDTYYVQTTDRKKRGSLQAFHNLFVKKILITSVTKVGDTLIDLSVGKGGDLSKWLHAKPSFVFGIDLSREGIEGFTDGACKRYMEEKIKSIVPIFDALFVVGDSSKNLRSGDAVEDKYRTTLRAIFGEGTKTNLPKGVLKQYGVGEHGFQVTSMQFAMHYMFESSEKLQGFIRNLCECTRVGGYFIGTCYDGNRVFKLLETKKLDDRVYFGEEDTICEIIKLYTETEFKPDETSLGYKINVFQNTIGQYIQEYLVNFEYFQRLMENYGFIVLPEEEARDMGLTTGLTGFSEMFRLMKHQIETGVAHASDFGQAPSLNSEERRLSFLNNYFIFKKIREVDTIGQVQKAVKVKKGKKITIA